MATKISDATQVDLGDSILLAAIDPSAPSGARVRAIPGTGVKAALDGRYATTAALAAKADASVLEGLPDAVALKATQDEVDALEARTAALEAAIAAIQASGAVTLNTLTLSAATFREDAVEGAIIGSISGKSTGSTLSLDPDDGKVEISSDQTKLLVGGTAATAGTLDYDLIETLSGATGSPKTTSISIVVTAAPAEGGGTASTAFPGWINLVPGTSLVTNQRNSKAMTHDYEVGCMSLTNPNVSMTQTEAASSLINVLTGTLPSGLRRDSGNRVWADTGFKTYSGLYFPPGSEFIPNASNVVLEKSFLYQARVNPQSNPTTLNNVTLLNPRTGAYSWDDLIKEGGQLTLYRVVGIFAPGDFLKAKHLKSMRQCFVYGAGDHGDMMQYAPAFASVVEESYLNQCSTAVGETSIWRSESGYAGAVEMRTSVLVVDNINAIQFNNQGLGGTFYMHDNLIIKETDDAGSQYTGGILYPGTTAANGNTINTNPLGSRDASSSSGYKWDGSSYLAETA